MANPVKPSDDDPCPKTDTPKSNIKKIFRSLSDVRVPSLFILAVVSLTLGTIGFHRYFTQSADHKSLATALYNAIWLFTIEPGNLNDPIPWELEIARWLSPAIAMYALLLGFAAIFRDQVSLLSLGFWRNHVIICGLGQKGLNIARNFRENGYRVVIIEKDGNNPNIASCREFGAIVLIGDARDEYLLDKGGIKRGQYLIGVCGEDGVNSDIAVIARKLVANRSGSTLNCSIHIKDPNLWVLLRAQEFTASYYESFRLDIFNIYDQGAKQLFREFPFSDEPSRSVAIPHLLIVGFGDFAEQLILNATRTWSPYYGITKQKLHISIIDPQANVYVQRLCQEYSLIDQLCEWNSLEFDTNSTEFLKAEFLFDKNKSLNVTIVYVMVEDESIGLSSALTLLDRIGSFPVRILVRMNEEKGLANLIRESKKYSDSFKQLSLFGLMERTCKLNLIYNSSHESISRAIHEEYVRQEELKGNQSGSSPILVTWDCLTEEYKEMNRTQADSIGAKLKTIHCGIVPWCDYGGENFVFISDEIELMAKMEHDRWCEQKRMQGWVYGPARDDRKKIHPSMVPYDDPNLSEVEKDKDRHTVRQIPHFLALAGYQIYRI